jgi:hypothetical protein
VLVHVEPAGLDLRLDADAPRQLQAEEDQERRAERERADGDEAERLDAELVQAAAVEEAAEPVASSSPARAGSEAEGERAPDAGHPVSGDSADRIVDAIRSTRSTPRTTITPATKPTSSAPTGDERTCGGDRDQCRDRAFSIIEMSGFLITSHDVISAPNTPAPRRCSCQRDVGEEAEPTEVDREGRPGLNPNQPNQRMITPRVV